MTRRPIRRPERRPIPSRAAAVRARSARSRLAAWVAVLTAATVLPVGLATVVAPPAAAATTSTTFALPPSGAAHIALTPDGTAYASNAGADSIARVTDAGVVTDVVLTVADMPLGIVADADGTVYSAQYGDSTISRIAPDGTATAAWVTLPWNIHPYDLAIDPDGNLYTANPPRRTVSKIAPDGTPTLAWGSEPSQPIAVAADPTGGGILTANSNGSLSHFAPNGARTVIRGPQASYAVGIAYAPDGTAYVVDPDRTVTRISSGGVVTPGWATVSGPPAGLAVDGLGNVYVSHDDAIAKIDPTGTVTAAWATLPTGSLPGWLAANADGSRVWVGSLSTGAVIRVAEFFPPAAVRTLAVTGGDRALELAFDVPTSDGGSAVTGYQVSTDGGTTWAALTTVAGARLTSTVSTASDGGALVNGTSYDVVVRAVNAAGPGAESAAESATPATIPGTVGALAVTGGDRALELSFDAPASTGGSVVTGYQVSTDGGVSWDAFAPTTDDDGRLTARLTTTSDGEPLVNGTSYGVVVRAINAVGEGAVSATVTAAPVAPPAPPVTAPGPPTDVTVIPGDRQATVSWDPPDHDGGAPITGYTVEATPEGTGGGAGVSVVPAGGRLPKAMAITKARVGAVAPPGRPVAARR
jgi:hypothetical protein